MLAVPFDDLLIGGPSAAYSQFRSAVNSVSKSDANAVVGFPGFFRDFGELLNEKAWIINVTASTVMGVHTDKRQVTTVQDAVRYGADAIAVHVNFTDERENHMLETFGRVAAECHGFEMPVFALAYVRCRKNGADDNYEVMKREKPDAYAALVAHACRVVVELGADIVKTHFTGSVASFSRVVEAVHPTPVVIAGGPLIAKDEALCRAREALRAGGGGICFGRNTVARDNPATFLSALHELFD